MELHGEEGYWVYIWVTKSYTLSVGEGGGGEGSEVWFHELYPGLYINVVKRLLLFHLYVIPSFKYLQNSLSLIFIIFTKLTYMPITQKIDTHVLKGSNCFSFFFFYFILCFGLVFFGWGFLLSLSKNPLTALSF